MEKLGRFAILTALYVLSFVIVFTIIPTIAWVFGGSFKFVAQSVPYVALSILFINLFLGVVFGECFDSNFKSKR
jgi:hypothetical protein